MMHLAPLYLALPDVELSKFRVAERVAHGGHDIPLAAIERRFTRSLHNLLNLYAPTVHHTQCFYNAGTAPELIFEQVGQNRQVVDTALYQKLLKGLEQ